MIKNIILTSLLLCLSWTSCIAQETLLSSITIDKELIENSNVVIRKNDVTLTIHSSDEVVYEVNRIVTALNKPGFQKIGAYEQYSNNTSINKIRAVIYDKEGKEIEVIKKQNVVVFLPPYYPYNLSFNPRAAYIPTLLENESSDNSKIQKIKRVVIDEENIPALIKEPMSGSINNYRSKLIMELSGKRFPNKPLDLYATSWDKVVANIYQSPNFGKQLERTNFFEADLEILLKGKSKPKEQVEAIFDFVKKKVKWNDFYGVYAQKGIKDAYQDGSGNVADVNLLLTAILQKAGLQAKPVLISTRNNNIPFHPTREGFNYVITEVSLGDKTILLDATEKYNAINILPNRVLNWQGRAINENGSSYWLELNPKKNSKTFTLIQATLKGDGSVEGMTQKRYTDYLAYAYRESFNSRTEEALIKYFEEDEVGLAVTDVATKNEQLISKPLDVSFNFNQKDSAEEIGGNLYLSPLLFEATTTNPFFNDQRTLPIDFIKPITQKVIVNITIPDGYEVESLPESIKTVFGQDDANYLYVVKRSGSVINITSDFKLNLTLVMPEDYKVWKDFFGKIVEKESEKIVLKKI